MKLYNTPKKSLETLKPLSPTKTTVYTCGPTVYDYPHIGNWFTFIRYDILIRTLKLQDLNPEWVMNITDVGHLVSDADDGEDKLEKGAKREGRTAWEVAEFYTKYFMEGLERLRISTPHSLPQATDHIQEQIDLIKRLEAKDMTYVIDDGVYYDTAKFPRYADFAQLRLDEQEAGARVEVNEQKRNQTDFALWKFSPQDQHRDMEWDSPWGKGFPGWHLECSAMAMKYLGETIDIHAGGIDHIPVHHTNEIAQSEAATGKPFAHYWMHTNHITVDGEKIAKSAGNGITLEDLEAKGFHPLDLRMLVLESHYRSQSKFSWETLEAAKNRLTTLQQFADLQHQADDATAASLGDTFFTDARRRLTASLASDLNTPEFLRILSEIVSHIYTYGKGISPVNELAFKEFLVFLDEALGLDLSGRPGVTDNQKQLLRDRWKARSDKDWGRSDQLRDELAKQGIGINDSAMGQIWFRL